MLERLVRNLVGQINGLVSAPTELYGFGSHFFYARGKIAEMRFDEPTKRIELIVDGEHTAWL